MASSKVNVKNKNNFTGNKTRIILIIAAFAAVGVVILIRSFAATVIYQVNTADVLSGNSMWSSVNARVVDVPDGKKTVKVTEISGGGSLAFTPKLNIGIYTGCFNIKPTAYKGTTPGVGIEATNSYGGGGGGDSFLTLNTYKEVCMDFAVQNTSGLTKLKATFPVEGTFQITTFNVKPQDNSAVLYTLSNVQNAKDSQFTFTNTTQVSDASQPVKVLQVPEGGKISFKTTALSDGEYYVCYNVKAATSDAVSFISVAQGNLGGAGGGKVGQAGFGPSGTPLLSTTAYVENCTYSFNVSGASASQFETFFTSYKGTWLVYNFSLHRGSYGSGY